MERRKTPIMGWASWNCFRTEISEEILKKQADLIVSTGLKDCGYTFLNVDDGFFGGRDENGDLIFNKEKFPNGLKVISDYAHSLGLSAGIYSEGGDNTCGFYYDKQLEAGCGVGLYNHEEKDLSLFFEELDYDFIKIDWCGGLRLGLSEEEQYTKIGKIIDKIREKTGKPIVYNICRWQFPGAWATKIADSWRTCADIRPTFKSILHQLDVIKPLYRYCKPGHVNDLDMMQIGNGLSSQEEKTHFAMWCMMSTPLMIGCDLSSLKEETLNLLKNKELIEINQDSACLQAFTVREELDENNNIKAEIWVKDLGKKDSNIKAVAFLNRSDFPVNISTTLSEIGLKGNVIKIRDLTENKDVKENVLENISLKAHGVTVLKIECEDSIILVNKWDKGEYIFKPLEKISVEEALKLRREGNYLVFSGTEEEFKDYYLEGAINLPYTDIHDSAKEFLTEKDKKVVVYCKTGKRSAQSHMTLDYLGYDVYYLGGIK